MAKATYFGDTSNKARKGKKTYFGDANNKARKVKKMYIGDANNKARLFFSGSLFGKAHAMFSETRIPVVLNNDDFTNDTGWTITKLAADNNMYPGSFAYAFGKYWHGYVAGKSSTGLKYSTDGKTFTNGPAINIPRLNGVTPSSTPYITGEVMSGPFINCDGRLFARFQHAWAQGGSQSGGGGNIYFTFLEFGSTGALIGQATGYDYDFSSVNSGYGPPVGNFNRDYTELAYHNGYIYYGMHERVKEKVNNSYKAVHYLSLARYKISDKTFETVHDKFHRYQEGTHTTPEVSTGSFHLFQFETSLLIVWNKFVFRHDLGTGALTTIITTDGNPFDPITLLRVNEDTFLRPYPSQHEVYKYNGTTLTLITTHTNTYKYNGKWAGDRYIALSASRATKKDTTAVIQLAYTLDGITFTIKDNLLTTPDGSLDNYSTSATSFFIAEYPIPS